MRRAQKTLARAVTFEGVGVHLGEKAAVKVGPAGPDHGLVFVRREVEIPALVSRVVRCQRSTVLGVEGVEVSTVEHLLAALVCLGIDNASIEMEGPEVPILDGSSAPFYEALTAVETVVQNAFVEPFRLPRPLFVSEGNALMLALPSEQAVLEYVLDYEHPMLGCQQVSFRPGVDDFGLELASARTFALWEEVQPLLEQGLARGGDFSNALVVYQDRYSTPLRMPLEPVRHKCLDLVGDLALLGRPLQARVVALRAGHRLHVALAKKIVEEFGDAQWDRDSRKDSPSLPLSASG